MTRDNNGKTANQFDLQKWTQRCCLNDFLWHGSSMWFCSIIPAFIFWWHHNLTWISFSWFGSFFDGYEP